MNFIQIHTLHSYSAALLNRDDTGLAKRIMFGGKMRTRISSQCLKRHWRSNFDVSAEALESVRSRDIVDKMIRPQLKDSIVDNKLLDSIESVLNKLVYGEKADERKSRQPLLFGKAEIDYLCEEAKRVFENAQSKKDIEDPDLLKELKSNLSQMRENAKLPGGLIAAMFGRMVTSDPKASIDAPIHVAHSFTTHHQESEMDYFTVVDDLQEREDDVGAAHIGDVEINNGLYYGYVVLDTNGLKENLARNEDLAKKTAKQLVHLIATVSPGAKKGSTAPYGYALTMLVEAGDEQPRSLADAFSKACKPTLTDANEKMGERIASMDKIFGGAQLRRMFSVDKEVDFPRAERLNLSDLEDWVAEQL